MQKSTNKPTQPLSAWDDVSDEAVAVCWGITGVTDVARVVDTYKTMLQMEEIRLNAEGAPYGLALVDVDSPAHAPALAYMEAHKAREDAHDTWTSLYNMNVYHGGSVPLRLVREAQRDAEDKDEALTIAEAELVEALKGP